MAKSKKDGVNKSQAIREALDAHPDKSPSQIAEDLKAKGLAVNAQYVSTIKSNARKKGRRSTIVRRRKPGLAHHGLGPFRAALKFIREVGGFDQARQALATIEEIQHAVR